MRHFSCRSVSSSPQLPDGWFGSSESKPAALNLVEGSPTAPCEARPFPFWLATLIATLALALGAVGLRLWILPIILAEPEFDAPTIDVRNSKFEEKRTEEGEVVRHQLPHIVPCPHQRDPCRSQCELIEMALNGIA